MTLEEIEQRKEYAKSIDDDPEAKTKLMEEIVKMFYLADSNLDERLNRDEFKSFCEKM